MAKIAYLLLCHKDPEGIIAQAERLTAAGDFIAIHFDARARREDFESIRAALAANPAVTFAAKRIKCGWGEWSLVEASLSAVQSAIDAFPRATHFYMLSGDCMPIKTVEYAHGFLDATDCDYIESVDFFTSEWIKTGIRDERLIYRHYFNERTQKKLFYTAMEWQKRLKLARKVPQDIQMMIGSQWWCLRRRTIEMVLNFCKTRPDVMRFFRTTWIPDETFVQTVVRHLVPEHEIKPRTLTFLMFTDYGLPISFYNDQYDLLLSQDYLFARKISPDALELKERLGNLYSATGVTFGISNEGRKLFKFLVGRGRIGRRFAPRFWETESSLGRQRTLLMVTCKKWHVAKRLVDRVRQVTNMPAVDYLFNEPDTPLPDLGGIQTTLEKRTRHRRALLRMLFDYWQSDVLLVCIDPANTDLMQDFYNDKAKVRLLEIECEFTDDFLIGHAKRVGLAADRTPQEVLDRLLPTIRYDVRFESDRIRDAGFPSFYQLRERDSVDENTVRLAEFLDIPPEKAREIAGTHYLFVD
jgi:hypothetical protein